MVLNRIWLLLVKHWETDMQFAVLGRKDIMDIAQNTFISSTFWTERIGPAAGLKTLDVMERENLGII